MSDLLLPERSTGSINQNPLTEAGICVGWKLLKKRSEGFADYRSMTHKGSDATLLVRSHQTIAWRQLFLSKLAEDNVLMKLRIM